jgi:L-aminopeptidase/D-esterase-like protein
MKRMIGAAPGGPGNDVIHDPVLRSTTLVVVATNVTMTKTQLTKVAMMANCGAARAIRPYHTTGDGDQLFAVSTAKLQRPDLPLTLIGSLAADLIADAIVRGVRAATGVTDWPAVRDL